MHTACLPAFIAPSDNINVIVDTPRGSPNKFKLDEGSGLFMLGAPLSAGLYFPFEFGFIPSTRGGDGDPLDVLILMDAPTFVGCLVQVRLLGVITARQTESGKTERNDRLIGTALTSRRHSHLRNLSDLPRQLLDEIEHFFICYNEIKGKKFQPTSRLGAARAVAIVRAGSVGEAPPPAAAQARKASRRKSR